MSTLVGERRVTTQCLRAGIGTKYQTPQNAIHKMSDIVEIVPYNSVWPELFAAKAAVIKEALGSNCLAIHHVGSTSVLGLAGKPKIDIIALVRDLALPDNKLADLGCIYRGGFNLPLRKSFDLSQPPVNINLHIFEEDDSEIDLNLIFRDYLRQNPDVRDQYQKLKY